MSLENIAAGLFNFDPTRSAQIGNSMGAQMMEVALRSQQMQLDAGAKWDQAALAADRNAMSRRTQMFNEMTANLNRFDAKAKEGQAAMNNEALVSSYSGGGGGGSSQALYGPPSTPAYPGQGESTPAISPAVNDAQYLDAPTDGFSSAPSPSAMGADPNAVSFSEPIEAGRADISTIQGSANERMAQRAEFGSRGRDLERPGDVRRMDRKTRVTNDLSGPSVSFSQADPPQQRQPQPNAIQMGQGQPSQSQRQFAFKVDRRTRDEYGGQSVPGGRTISLDYNSSDSGGNYAMIVIPNDANEQERDVAKRYVNDVTGWFRQNGIEVGEPVVKTAAENGRGVGGFFHTEPAFVQNTAAMGLLQNKAPEYAQILASTLGTLPGATFIPPHKKNDPGASGSGFLPERDFAKEYLIPNLEAISRNGSGRGAVAGNLSAYSPRRGASNVSGAGGEGGYAAARPGPDGVAQVRTLDDFVNGRAPYVTVAGNPQLNGKKYTIPSISYEDASGNVQTLQDVPAIVHDTGSAFGNAPEGRFDIPIARDQNDTLMAKNHARWKDEGVSFIPMPMEGEAPKPEPIGNAPAGPIRMTTMERGQFPDELLPEGRAVAETRTSFQQTLEEKKATTMKLLDLRRQDLEIQAAMSAVDRRAENAGSTLFQLGRERARVTSSLEQLEVQNKSILAREQQLSKALFDGEAALKMARDQQGAYMKTTPDAQPVIDRESMVDAYIDAEPRERIKMRTRFADDKGLLGSFDMAEDFLKNQSGDSRTFKIGGNDYTVADLARFYTPTTVNDTAKPNGVQTLVEGDPKLKEEVMAIKGQSAPAQTAPTAAAPVEPGADPVRAKIDALF